MNSQKTTIFRQLILNIAIPTLLALLIFALINFFSTKSLITKENDEKNILLSNELTKILRFQDIAIYPIDVELNNRFKEFSSILVNKYFANTDKIKDIDLRVFANKIGMDAENEDIYVISTNGIIVNTTFTKDLGLNLYSLGKKMVMFLQGIFKKGEFVADFFAIEHRTKKARKYTYQPTLDGKYIIEIGAYSKHVNDIVMAIENAKTELKEETEGIVDIELFLSADQPFTMNQNSINIPSQDDILLETFHDRDTKSIFEQVGDKWYQYEYIYMERAISKNILNSSLYKGSVIRIILDRTKQKVLFRIEAIRFVFIFVITFGIIGFLIYRKTKVITLPLKKLVENVNSVKNGFLMERAEVTGNNEITILAQQFNNMVENIELKNKTLIDNKAEIETIHSDLTASITYAKYIQSAILTQKEQLDLYLKDYFILFNPCDIISGDFYWVTNFEKKTIISAADCTGHGVPGALMSMLGVAFLNEIVNKEGITLPEVILNHLRTEVIRSLQQKAEIGRQIDGMDIALCVIDYANMKLQFAGANNPMYIIRKLNGMNLNSENAMILRDYSLYEIKGDKMPISINDLMDNFTHHEADIFKGDILYLFTDGFADQFGGELRKKYYYHNFKKLLLDNCTKSMEEQQFCIEKALNDWKGCNKQIDDILVIGIRII
jgi:serine phosphatase RsbU (regulator of sigma subunit)